VRYARPTARRLLVGNGLRARSAHLGEPRPYRASDDWHSLSQGVDRPEEVQLNFFSREFEERLWQPYPMPRGGLDERIRYFEQRGYEPLSRGSQVAVLARGPQPRYGLAHLAVAIGGVLLAAFGVWRGAVVFFVVGMILLPLTGLDWWVRARPMIVRLTIDPDGHVREEMLGVSPK
jgi:hypothetical protein